MRLSAILLTILNRTVVSSQLHTLQAYIIWIADKLFLWLWGNCPGGEKMSGGNVRTPGYHMDYEMVGYEI